MATAHQIRDLIAQTTTGRPFHFHMVEVGFSHVRDRVRRHYLNNLPTSFVLDDEAVDRLREAGREVLRNSEEFQRFLGTLKAESLDSSQP